MTKTDLYSTAIKIFGLYFLVLFVQDVFGSYFYSAGMLSSAFEGAWYMYASVFVKSAIDIAVFFVATLRTELVLNKFFKADDKTIQLELQKSDWFELALFVIGITVVIDSIPNLLNVIVNKVYYRNNPEAFGLGDDMAPVFLNIFQLVIGILTILNARNFSKLAIKLGERDDEQDEENER